MSKRVSIAMVLVLGASLMWVMPPSGAATARVKAAGSSSDGFRWDPSTRSINRGDTIVWTNPTGKNHTVSAYGGNWSKSDTIEPGERTNKRFRKRGTFRYRCLVRGHSTLDNGRCVGMCGRIVVQ